MGRVQEARKKWGEAWAKDDAVTRAEEVLAEAREGAAKQLVADILGQGGQRSAVAMAEEALAEARQAATSHRATAQSLENEEYKAAEALERANVYRRMAVTSVLAADPAVQDLLGAYRAARRRVGDLATALRVVNTALPFGWSADHYDDDADRGADAPWRAAVEALAHNADAPMPGLADA